MTPANYCSHCGDQLDAGSKFCGKCGCAVDSTPVASPVSQKLPHSQSAESRAALEDPARSSITSQFGLPVSDPKSPRFGRRSKIVMSALGFVLLVFAIRSASTPSDTRPSTPDSEIKPSTPDSEIKPSTPTIGIALKCDEPGGSGGAAHYLYYGDALKEFFEVPSYGGVESRVTLSLKDSTDTAYTYDCRELDPDAREVRGCSSFTLQRDSLQLSANHSYSATMAEARGSDTSTDKYQCQTMDKDEAAKILAQRNQAIQK